MNTSQEPKKYAAFISYRHVMPDMAIAQKLQKMLEHNQVRPNRYVHKNIRPVFLDTCELPTQENLDESILQALANSDCLYVICSPELPNSKYCKREIEYFKKLHGGRIHRIYTLLVGGTPAESFPEILRTENRIVQDENGYPQTIEREVEPLFADIRASSLRKSLRKLRKTEYLRLAAAYYGCSYDALYKRRKRWLIKVAAYIAFVIFTLCVSFGVYVRMKNLQYDASRAATYASYAEEQITEKNELLAMSLCMEGWESAKKGRSNRYMTALRSAATQSYYRLRAGPVQCVWTIETEHTDSPILYMNDDHTLIMALTDYYFHIIDAKTGAILQQYPIDSAAVDPDNTSIYTTVEAIKDENGEYQDTLFLRTPEGLILDKLPFRKSTIKHPLYKIYSVTSVPGLKEIRDQNTTIAYFTEQGKLLTLEDVGQLERQQTEMEKKEPFYVTKTAGLTKNLIVKNSEEEEVFALGLKNSTYCFTPDFSRFGFTEEGFLKIYETEQWTQIGETPYPEGLLLKAYLLNESNYALLVYRSYDDLVKALLIDWSTGSQMHSFSGYAYPDEKNNVFYCMDGDHIAKYAYRNLNTDSVSMVIAMCGENVLSKGLNTLHMKNASNGKEIWKVDKIWSMSYNQDLTRILIFDGETLRCINEAGDQLWSIAEKISCSALSNDGKLAAYIIEGGDLYIVSGTDGTVIGTIPTEVFQSISSPSTLSVFQSCVFVHGSEQTLGIPFDSSEAFQLMGTYEKAIEASDYAILVNDKAYVMDFAVWDMRSQKLLFEPEENTGFWDWSEESGYIVRHKQISGNHDTYELAVHRLSNEGIEEIGVLMLPKRSVSALRLDSTGRWLSICTEDISLVYDLASMEKVLELTDCFVYYENGHLWNWYTYDGYHFSMPLIDDRDLYGFSLDMLTSDYGVRELSVNERSLYTFRN